MSNEVNKSSFTNLEDLVEGLKNKYLYQWWNISIEFPELKRKYSYKEKLQKERELEDFTSTFTETLNNPPRDEGERERWRDDLKSSIREFGRNTLEFEDGFMDILLLDGYGKVTNDFIAEAKRFQPDINVMDIFQAIRNVWIMNSIQILLNLEVEFSPSIFAYSMLYPYTDNYIDNPDYPMEDKISFNERFRQRLTGFDTAPENKHEESIFKLVEIIESQFPRDKYPDVYGGLLAIHGGQEESLLQQKGRTMPYEKDILGISFQKGGTSVLADGYLIRGNLTYKEADFVFGYGVFLQLADDLQDVMEDNKNGHMTIFSQLAKKWPLDPIGNRLFRFIDTVLSSAREFPSSKLHTLMGLISTSCRFLIFEAISKNRNLYSRRYVKIIEEYSMFRFSYIKKFKRKMRKKYSSVNIDNIGYLLGDDRIDIVEGSKWA